MIKHLKAYFPAGLLTYIIAVSLSTQHVMGKLAELGMPVTMETRISSIFHDLLGMSGSLLPLVMIAMAIGLLVAARLTRRLPGHRVPLCVLAGFASMLTLHLIMAIVFGLTPIAPAREFTGLLGQAISGAVGGLLYAALSKRV